MIAHRILSITFRDAQNHVLISISRSFQLQPKPPSNADSILSHLLLAQIRNTFELIHNRQIHKQPFLPPTLLSGAAYHIPKKGVKLDRRALQDKNRCRLLSKAKVQEHRRCRDSILHHRRLQSRCQHDLNGQYHCSHPSAAGLERKLKARALL